MTPPNAAPRTPPAAWAAVAGAALSMFTVFGVAYSFGTFVKPMAAEFGASRGAANFVFGVTAFAYFGLGVVTGPLVHRVGPRAMLLVAGITLSGGLVATSKVNELWQGYLTYGLGVGIAVACGYVPLVAVVGAWFDDRRRAAALGAAVAGIGLGTLIAAPLSARLINRHGWRDAYLTLAAVSAVLMAVALVLTRAPAHFAAPATRPLRVTVRTRPFLLLYGAAFLMTMTLFSSFVNLAPYAEDQGISKVAAASLISVLGGASVAGRLGLGALSARIGGGVRAYQASFLTMAASQLLWLSAADRYPQLVLYALVMGVGYGGFIALSPAVAAELFGPAGLGATVGALYTGAGVSALIGPYAGGWLVDRSGGYEATIWAGLVAGALGAAVLSALRSPARPGTGPAGPARSPA